MAREKAGRHQYGTSGQDCTRAVAREDLGVAGANVSADDKRDCSRGRTSSFARSNASASSRSSADSGAD
ncbi:hypothetical protein PF003_g27748 [Phytophthora fragariae]|nr:hypothetical protein PF003_g27748 [Phytophthora fragariae]